MKAEEGIKILETGISAAELLSCSSDYSGSLYESIGTYLFHQLRPYMDQLQLYMLDENQKVMKEEAVCSDRGTVQGEDLIPLYQLPEEVDKHHRAIQLQIKQAFSLYVPLVVGDRLMGLLLFGCRQGWDQNVQYFEILGKTVAMGIQHLLSSRTDHRYASFFNKTIEISNSFHQASSVEQLVKTFARLAVTHLNFDRITVFLYKHMESKVEMAFCATSWGWETMLHKAYELPGNISTLLPINRKTGYWFPLIANSMQIGLVLFDNLYSQYSIPEDHLYMLTPLCNQFSANIQNIRLLQDVQRAAQRDILTDLYNRKYFEMQFTRLDSEENYPLSIIMGDVNGLKITNDIFGHFEGDIVLREIASILKGVCRKEDIVARWGGDEYVILLPKTTENRVKTIIQAVRKQCEATKNTKIHLSISMGYAIKKHSSEDLKMIMKKAEERMYRNKLQERIIFRNVFIDAMREMLHQKCQEPNDHIDRMDYMSALLGKFMRLSDNDKDELKLLAMLHDIGKVAINPDILNKPGKLNKEEWNEIKKHPEAGYRIAQASAELSRIANFILSHHERWDGKGYPMGKKGLEIPLLSRIIAVIDAFDVMTHERIYKTAMPYEEALLELKRCAGTQFDPDIVSNFIELQEALHSEK